jgi:hypothetical protein
MKTNLVISVIKGAALLLLVTSLILRPSTAVGQPTVISYQGQMLVGGNPANGNFDMTFTFYNVPTNGTPLAGPITVNPVAVNNGLFSVNFDSLDPRIFNFGVVGARFLEVAARPSGNTGAYTVLSPRQLLSQTPYAIAAQSAAMADSVGTNSVTAVGIAPGQVVKSLNGFEDVVTLTAGANITITPTPSGNGVTISGTGSGGCSPWCLAGNAGTTPGVDFLGTSDNEPLELQVNTQRALRLEPDLSGHASPNVIGGSANNMVSSAIGATIAGGGSSSAINSVMQAYGTVSGGSGNTAGGGNSTVSGGEDNTASGGFATVSGGSGNTAGAYWTMVGGGAGNTAGTAYATVGGGLVNNATNLYATVGGGYGNYAGGVGAFVGGGGYDGTAQIGNAAKGNASVVSGGLGNLAANTYGAVCGGISNVASGVGAFVGGGGIFDGTTLGNVASGDASVVGGGWGNTANNVFATVGGGYGNIASQSRATVSGGELNVASGINATVGGGAVNHANGGSSTVGGGDGNTASNLGATVSGGFGNLATGNSAVIGGGTTNQASNDFATIGGGYLNVASGAGSTIAGGYNNSAANSSDAIGGGTSNTIVFATALNGNNSVAGGGGNQIRSSEYGAIGGGQGNLIASGATSFTATGCTIPGGVSNIAGGNFSFAAGQQAHAVNDGSFVWADSQNAPFSSVADNEVAFRCAGGVRFTSGGVGLGQSICWTPGSAGWSLCSDRNLKEKFEQVDVRQVLEKVVQLPLTEWSYKGYADRHVGPMAQDFHQAFPFNPNDKMLNSADETGVALAAIQGLNQKLTEKDSELKELKQQNSALAKQLDELQAAVRSLLDKK